jgi:hypothetical protein
MDAELTDQLESLIDTHTASTIIKAIVEVCRLKAAHVNTYWQDSALAGEWESLADALDGIDFPY